MRRNNPTSRLESTSFVALALAIFLSVVAGTALSRDVAQDAKESADEPEVQRSQSDPEGLTLLFHTDFSDGNVAAWQPTDAKAWGVMDDAGNKVYALTGKSDYKPPVKSPFNISLIKGVEVSDFVIEAKIKSTREEYNHRDMCIIVGYQDPSHFYYIHLASKADEHANSIFLVNNAPRVSIAKSRTDGTVWGEGYHTVRVQRKIATAEINVYFDDMKTPVMTTTDKTFTHGLIGFGSFDDTGNVDDVKLWGRPYKSQK